jgi:hypothetical protein
MINGKHFCNITAPWCLVYNCNLAFSVFDPFLNICRAIMSFLNIISSISSRFGVNIVFLYLLSVGVGAMYRSHFVSSQPSLYLLLKPYQICTCMFSFETWNKKINITIPNLCITLVKGHKPYKQVPYHDSVLHFNKVIALFTSKVPIFTF